MMRLREKLRSWCPQPPTDIPTKLKRHSAPIAIVLTITLFTVTFSVFSSPYLFQPSTPKIPPPIGEVPAASGDPVTVDWQRAYGQGDMQNSVFYTKANSLIQTNDGAYAMAGCYNNSVFLGKVSASGDMMWNHTYGEGSAVEVVELDDGGFALACDISLSIVLIRTDSAGNALWTQTFSDSHSPQADWVPKSMAKSSDGGYVIAGYAPNENSLFPNQDFLLIKANSEGKLEWVKFFGGVGEDEARSVIQTVDGGYAVFGHTSSFGPYNNNFWLVKADSGGNLQWAKTYSRNGLGHKVGAPSSIDYYGVGDNRGYAVIQTEDGGYALAGYAGTEGTWLVKTDSNGAAQWNQTYPPAAAGYTTSEYSVVQTGDKGFAIAYQNVVTKTDSAGNFQWNQTYQNVDSPNPNQLPIGLGLCAVIETRDGGLAVLGTENSAYAGMIPSPCFYLAITASFLPSQSTPSFAAPSSTVNTHLALPTLAIEADGSVSPSNAPIRRSGNVYTFTANFSGSLSVNKNDVVINGAGFTLQGNGSITESDGSQTFIQFTEAGIILSNASDVEIRNLKLMDYVACILLDGSCSHINVQGNMLLGDIGTGILARSELLDSSITGNNFIALGRVINIKEAQSNLISGNVLTRQSDGGIYLNLGLNNTISNNFIFQGSGDSITFGSSTGNRIINNTITGTSTAIDRPQSSIIANNNITQNGYGIANAENCTIFENIISGNDIGIQGSDTRDNSIYRNNFDANRVFQAGQLE